MLIFIPAWSHAAANRSSACWRHCSEDASSTKSSAKRKQLILQLPTVTPSLTQLLMYTGPKRGGFSRCTAPDPWTSKFYILKWAVMHKVTIIITLFIQSCANQLTKVVVSVVIQCMAISFGDSLLAQYTSSLLRDVPVSSEISDLCEISDFYCLSVILLLTVKE